MIRVVHRVVQSSFDDDVGSGVGESSGKVRVVLVLVLAETEKGWKAVAWWLHLPIHSLAVHRGRNLFK